MLKQFQPKLLGLNGRPPPRAAETMGVAGSTTMDGGMMGGNTVPLEEMADGSLQLTTMMPMQLQGALDEHSWQGFASQINTGLTQENQEISGQAMKYKPCHVLGIILFLAGIVTFFLPLFTEASVPSSLFILFPFVGMLCIITGLFIGRRITEAAMLKSQGVFDQASNQLRQRVANVSLEVKSEKQIISVDYDHGRHRTKLVRYVEFAVAGSAGGGGVMQPQQQQFEMQQPGMPGMPGGNPLLFPAPMDFTMGGVTNCPICRAEKNPTAASCMSCGHRF